MNKQGQWFRRTFLSLGLLCTFAAFTSDARSASFNPEHALDLSMPVIAAPVDFEVRLVDESTVEFSWNPQLLDGSEVDYFRIWDSNTLLTETEDADWQMSDIDRNLAYDFSVSAITVAGEETRRSSRVYYDLPQLDPSLPDGFNQYLPPLENLQAEVIDSDSVRLTWDAARDFWSWADPSDYRYEIILDGTLIDTTDELHYTFSGLAERGFVWLTVNAVVEGQLSSRQPNQVLVNTDDPPGTKTRGRAGYGSLFGLRTAVYSSTAAELFWQVSSYPTVSHVYINGRLVARVREGLSLFIEELPPGEQLQVSVGEGWPHDEPPPFDWPQWHDYPLMHASITMPAGSSNGSGIPAPVSGLRADVYSSTAAELFWDRSDVVPVTYRIYLDGQLRQETDGTSLFLDGLMAGTQYQAEVSVVDADDAETDTREISFRTYRDTAASSQCRIDGLRASVYSTTAAEVFWDRKPGPIRYELWLDDEHLLVTDAVSWFREGFTAGSTHTMTIGVDADDCREDRYSIDFQLAGSAVR